MSSASEQLQSKLSNQENEKKKIGRFWVRLRARSLHGPL